MYEIEKTIKEMPAMNANLMTVTNKINQFHQTAKNSILAISLILAEIAEKPNDYLIGSGFDKIVDYTEAVFGYKKAYTYKLIKISKFIKITDKQGKKLDVEYLLNDNLMQQLTDNDNYIKFDVLSDGDGFEYSTSQMLELIPLSRKAVEENSDILDSSLSCKELRAVVKKIINPNVETTATVSTSNEETPTGTDTAPEIHLTDKEIILKMLELCSKMQNEEVKEKIINVFDKSLNLLEKVK